MKRKLSFTDKEYRSTNTNNYLLQAGVIVGPKAKRIKGNAPTYSFSTEEDGSQKYVLIGSINGARRYPVRAFDDIEVDETKGEITFSSYGKIYTVRAFQDTDGLWASRLRTMVPGEALEEMYMEEVKMAFSPDAPAQDESLYAAVDEESGEVKYLVYTSLVGMYTRSNRGWFKVPDGDESLDGLDVYEVDPKFIKVFDKAEAEEQILTSDDANEYERNTSFFDDAVTAAAGPEEYTDCPEATQEITVNLENREYAIEKAGYGPLNPNEPNEEFWEKKAKRWSVSVEEAKKSVCGNCVMFIRTPKMLDCIASGLSAGEPGSENAWDAIDKAELGYCEGLDFKCAASRTCDAWVVGGPITEEE